MTPKTTDLIFSKKDIKIAIIWLVIGAILGFLGTVCLIEFYQSLGDVYRYGASSMEILFVVYLNPFVWSQVLLQWLYPGGLPHRILYFIMPSVLGGIAAVLTFGIYKIIRYSFSRTFRKGWQPEE